MVAQLPNNVIANRIRQNSSNFADPFNANDDEMSKNVIARRRLMPMEWLKPNLSVRKDIQLTVLSNPDTSVAISKSIQLTILSNPDTSVSIGKTLQHVVLNAVDNSVTVRKNLQHDVVAQPDNAVSIRKQNIYIVLDAPPYTYKTDKPVRYSKFFQNKPTQPYLNKRKGGPLAKRLYVFMIT